MRVTSRPRLVVAAVAGKPGVWPAPSGEVKAARGTEYALFEKVKVFEDGYKEFQERATARARSIRSGAPA
jgi:hypothetical protein